MNTRPRYTAGKVDAIAATFFSVGQWEIIILVVLVQVASLSIKSKIPEFRTR